MLTTFMSLEFCCSWYLLIQTSSNQVLHFRELKVNVFGVHYSAILIHDMQSWANFHCHFALYPQLLLKLSGPDSPFGEDLTASLPPLVEKHHPAGVPIAVCRPCAEYLRSFSTFIDTHACESHNEDQVDLPSCTIEVDMQQLDLAPAMLGTYSSCLLLRGPVFALWWWGVYWHLQCLIERRGRPPQ